MGRGNQIIRDRDGNNVNTYYFDGNDDFEATKKSMMEDMKGQLSEELEGLGFAMRRRKLEQMMRRGRYPVRVSDDSVWSRMSEYDSEDVDNLTYELKNVPGFERVKPWRSESDLAAGFRDSASVIAESKNCMVVIADNETSTAIACVPSFSWDELEDDAGVEDYHSEAEADLWKTRERADANYEITGDDIRKRAVEMLTESRRKAYLEDANAAMKAVHEHFGSQSIRVRSCAWTSTALPAATAYEGAYYE